MGTKKRNTKTPKYIIISKQKHFNIFQARGKNMTFLNLREKHNEIVNFEGEKQFCFNKKYLRNVTLVKPLESLLHILKSSNSKRQRNEVFECKMRRNSGFHKRSKLFPWSYPKWFVFFILMLVIISKPQSKFLRKKTKFKLLPATMFGLLFLQFKELLIFYIEAIDENFFLFKFIFIIFWTPRLQKC